jgi:hypothetical protein
MKLAANTGDAMQDAVSGVITNNAGWEVLMKERITGGRVAPTRVAKAATGLKEIVVIGLDRKGEFYAASSSGDVDKVLCLMEMLRRRLLDGTYEDV